MATPRILELSPGARASSAGTLGAVASEDQGRPRQGGEGRGPARAGLVILTESTCSGGAASWTQLSRGHRLALAPAASRSISSRSLPQDGGCWFSGRTLMESGREGCLCQSRQTRAGDGQELPGRCRGLFFLLIRFHFQHLLKWAVTACAEETGTVHARVLEINAWACFHSDPAVAGIPRLSVPSGTGRVTSSAFSDACCSLCPGGRTQAVPRKPTEPPAAGGPSQAGPTGASA